MTPEEAYTEIKERLAKKLEEFLYLAMDPTFQAKVDSAIQAILNDFISRRGGSSPVRLPCGHIRNAEDLQIKTGTDRDILNMSFLCPQCGELGKRMLFQDLLVLLRLDMTDKRAYLKFADPGNTTKDLGELDLDTLTLYAKSGKTTCRLRFDKDVEKKDRLEVSVTWRPEEK